MRLICETTAEHDHIRRHWRLLRNLLGHRHAITVEVPDAPPISFPALSQFGSSGRDPER